MLLAQRKKREKITCKIGHSEEEYNFNERQHVVSTPHYGNSRRCPLWRRPDVNPISWQENQHYQQQPQLGRRTPSLHMQLPERSPYQIKKPYLDTPQVNFTSRQSNIIGNGSTNLYPTPVGLSTGLSTGLPAVFSAFRAAPVFPTQPVVNSTPPRFSSVLGAAPVVPMPQFTPSVSAALPHLGQVAPSAPLPLLQASHLSVTTPSVSPVRTPLRVQGSLSPCNNTRSIISQGRNAGRHRQLRDSVGNEGFFFGGHENARLQARQRAQELQAENARLSEERRRQREREKQLELEEERRMERLAREQREKLAEKEREEMNAEGFAGGRRRAGKAKSYLSGGDGGRGSEKALEENLQKQNEKTMRQTEETRERIEKEKKAAEEFARNLMEPLVDSKTKPDFLSPEKWKEPGPLPSLQDSSFFVKRDPLLGDTSNFLKSSGLNSSASFAPNLPTDNILPPLTSFDVAAPTSSAPFAEWTGLSSGLPTPKLDSSDVFLEAAASRGESLGAGSKRYESQLREMITNHTDLQRMLEMDVRKHKGQPTTGTATKLTEPLISSLDAHQPSFLSQFKRAESQSLSPARHSLGQPERSSAGDTVPFAAQEPSAFSPRGILKTTSSRTTRIPEVTINPTPFVADGAAEPSLNPRFVKLDPDELSAEPSRFIG